MSKRFLVMLVMLLALPALANAWFVNAKTSPTTGMGTISPAGNKYYATGANSGEYMVTPAVGYKVGRVTLDGAQIQPNENGNYVVPYLAGKSWRYLVAYFTTNTIDITTSISAGSGAIREDNLESLTNIPVGSARQLLIIPNPGYKIASLTAEGATISGDDNGKIAEYYNLQENQTVSAAFSLIPVVSVNAGPDVNTTTAGTATLVGNATSNQGAITYSWTGYGLAFGSMNEAVTTVSATTAGDYVATLTVTSGGIEVFDTVAITVINDVDFQVAVCTACHGGKDDAIITAYGESQHKANSVSCQGCHTGDRMHVVLPAEGTCAGCHVPLPHGEALTDCLKCHDPHSLGLSGTVDYPHNSFSCTECHRFDGGSTQPGDLCLSCHNGSSAALVATHANSTPNYGTWAMHCTGCHDPHWQDQIAAYGQASFVVSGTADAGGIASNSLTMTGAGWANDSLSGMILFPDLNDASYNYKIIGNTADTITVKGSMDGLPAPASNSLFAAIYGKLIRGTITTPSSGQREVRLFRDSGANSFADGDSAYDGICESCHTRTAHHRNDGTAPAQSHYDGSRCMACHTHASGFAGLDHAGAVLPVATCLECHGTAGSSLISGVHGGDCGLCHADPLGGGPLVEPYETTAPKGGSCTDCHGLFTDVHQNIDHTATPGTGAVVIFDDADHDDAAWGGERPYYDIDVTCTICHTTDLPAVHGNDCATCHTTPYDTLEGAWNGGCQQGGCHTTYHEDSTTAHYPFTDADCNLCHDSYSWWPTQASCQNCHASYGPGDVTPPVTSTDAQAQYIGPANIGFSITDNGKVGVGRTFYRLNGGVATAAGKYLYVTEPGTHSLDFWSMDQSGNVESVPKNVQFAVIADTTPPATTSNAQPNYTNGATITLTATDASTLGVKATYYRLGEGPTQSGTRVSVPATSGVISYTLTFWSEDWSGNVETAKSVTFTVTSGTGTIRLVWGDYDLGGSLCTDDPGAEAQWYIYRGTTLVSSGSAACPGWSGVNDVAVQVSPAAYSVIIDWWDSYYEYWDQSGFSNVKVTTPGQVVRLSY